MSTILLRKLTRKSTLTFGKYAGNVVQTLLDLKEYGHLRWCYYNFTAIDFSEDIKCELGIVGEYVIEKPGKNIELLTKLIHAKIENMTPLTRIISKNKEKKKRKSFARQDRAADRQKYNKKSLARYNHGHRDF